MYKRHLQAPTFPPSAESPAVVPGHPHAPGVSPKAVGATTIVTELSAQQGFSALVAEIAAVKSAVLVARAPEFEYSDAITVGGPMANNNQVYSFFARYPFDGAGEWAVLVTSATGQARLNILRAPTMPGYFNANNAALPTLDDQLANVGQGLFLLYGAAGMQALSAEFWFPIRADDKILLAATTGTATVGAYATIMFRRRVSAAGAQHYGRT